MDWAQGGAGQGSRGNGQRRVSPVADAAHPRRLLHAPNPPAGSGIRMPGFRAPMLYYVIQWRNIFLSSLLMIRLLSDVEYANLLRRLHTFASLVRRGMSQGRST